MKENSTIRFIGVSDTVNGRICPGVYLGRKYNDSDGADNCVEEDFLIHIKACPGGFAFGTVVTYPELLPAKGSCCILLVARM